jgi:hypothetical protein
LKFFNKLLFKNLSLYGQADHIMIGFSGQVIKNISKNSKGDFHQEYFTGK